MSEEERGAVHVEVRGACVALCFEEDGARQGRAFYFAPASAIDIATNLMRAANAVIMGKPYARKAEDEL